MNLLLTTAGRRTYLVHYFRSHLGPGDRVLGTSDRHSVSRALAPALFACDEHFLVPPIHDAGYTEHLLGLCQEHDVDVLVPLYDLDAYVLSEARERLGESGVLPMFSDRRVNGIAYDKYATFTFLTDAGLDAPATFLSPADFQASDLPYPVVLKPRTGFGSLGLTIVHSDKELAAHWLAAREPMVIQEYINGTEYGLDIFACESGVISVVPRRKIAMRFGETDQAVSVKSNGLMETGLRLGQALGHFGPLDADLVEREGRHWIFDLNPRFGGGYPVAHMAGADFTRWVIQLARGERIEPAIGDFEEGVVMYKDIVPRRADLCR